MVESSPPELVLTMKKLPRHHFCSESPSPFKSSPSIILTCHAMPSLLASFPFPIPIPSIPTIRPRLFRTMSSTTSTPDSISTGQTTVPGLNSDEIAASAREALFRRHSNSSSQNLKRSNSTGVVIVWFRNDLRLLDNEVLYRAWSISDAVLPVYCVDPRAFGTTYNFGFPKTGALRAKFLIESLLDLRKNLVGYGLNLLIKHGKPEDVLPEIARAFGAHTIFAQRETCSEEIHVEQQVTKGLKQVLLSKKGSSSRSECAKLQLIWGSTMYHIDDLPFQIENLPDVYTQFRKSVESKSKIRSCYKLPPSLGSPPTSGLDEVGGWGCVPSLDDLGLKEIKCDKGMCFLGGETAALGRVDEYFWKKDLVKIYKETRNGMLGPDYSTKFSPWLAFGCLSPRYIYEEVKRYEKERLANESTYWVLFELIWRDYFRFLSKKYGNSIFQLGGPRKVISNWSQDRALFEYWKEGKTGYPLIDANMKELATTGFMSNRGRQIVCSFLVRDMGIDWRMGAEWFETCLLDYDPCSNYGNWTYGAGIGNDPREDRYFSIPKQAQVYDPEGKYVVYWLPELQRLPREQRNFPGQSYIKEVVPLRFGTVKSKKDHGTKDEGNRRRTCRR